MRKSEEPTMKLRSIFGFVMVASVMGGAIVVPAVSNAQDYSYRAYRRHREDKRNEWRNIAIGAGALGVLGALTHDDTLMFGGAAGALYSTYRYDQDRRGHDRVGRLRARYFSRPYFYRDGRRYHRTTIWQDGQKYYRFERDSD